jgi:V8-like Glu-specific endopeptidase
MTSTLPFVLVLTIFIFGDALPSTAKQIATEAVYTETVCTDCDTEYVTPVARLRRDAFIFFEPMKRVDNREGSFLNAIGMIKGNKGATGTAFLIGACHILTNFHVAFSDIVIDKIFKGKEYDPKDSALLSKTEIEFSVGQSDDPKRIFETTVKGRPVAWGIYRCSHKNFYRKYPQNMPKTKPPELDLDEDWAVVELEQCVGDKYGLLNLFPADGERLRQMGLQKKRFPKTAGFPGDEDNRAIWLDEECEFSSRDEKNGGQFHYCSNKAGSSGSPIYHTDPQGHYVVALNSSSITSRDSQSNVFFPELTGHEGNSSTLVINFIDKIKPYIGEQSKITWQQNRGKKAK